MPRDLLKFVSEIHSPGVYIEELPSGLAPIEGAATSTVGFVGHAPHGPHGTAEKVTSFGEFARVFGELRSDWELGYAVSLFFANGGNVAWVAGVPAGAPLEEGLPGLEEVGVFGLVCLPGETDADVLRAALELAERRRALSSSIRRQWSGIACWRSPPSSARAEARAERSSIRSFEFPTRSRGTPRMCPPSGAVAGLYAGATWHVASGRRPPVRKPFCTGSRASRSTCPRGDPKLTAVGVNCIRRLPVGTVVWGARTLAPDTEWKYVNVRRLMLFLEQSIERGTSWAVFEPNDERLWGRLRSQCTNFLQGLFRAGAFVGTTSDRAFFVRCGRDTMTQSDIDNGRLVILVGVAALRPAEFVIISIEHNLAGDAGAGR